MKEYRYHCLAFETEKDARDELEIRGWAPKPGHGACWSTDGLTLLLARVLISHAVWGTGEDEADGHVLVTPAVYDPRYFVLVASKREFSHPNGLPWGDVPGQVTPFFAGAEQPRP